MITLQTAVCTCVLVALYLTAWLVRWCWKENRQINKDRKVWYENSD